MFPSPIGELHFSIGKHGILNTCKNVSVPYRGATFLNVLLFFIVLPPVSFRPLSGSYISQLNSHICSLNVCGLFPSPIGELHFSMLQLMLHHRNTQSFRPLSGSYISQYFISCVCLLFIFVSVPYRGATFLNCNNKKAWSWHAGERFPSPIGELHFSIVPCLQFSTDICFRPLSGSYISQ